MEFMAEWARALEGLQVQLKGLPTEVDLVKK